MTYRMISAVWSHLKILMYKTIINIVLGYLYIYNKSAKPLWEGLNPKFRTRMSGGVGEEMGGNGIQEGYTVILN